MSKDKKKAAAVVAKTLKRYEDVASWPAWRRGDNASIHQKLEILGNFAELYRKSPEGFSNFGDFRACQEMVQEGLLEQAFVNTPDHSFRITEKGLAELNSRGNR